MFRACLILTITLVGVIVATADAQDSVEAGILRLTTNELQQGEHYCFDDLYPEHPSTVHVVLEAYGCGNVAAGVEFYIWGLPDEGAPSEGEILEDWFFPVEGSLWEGMVLTITQPQDPSWIHLGDLRFIAYDEDWMGVDHDVQLLGPAYGFFPEIVFLSGYADHLNAGCFLFNPHMGDPENAQCYMWIDAVGNSTWSTVKSLY